MVKPAAALCAILLAHGALAAGLEHQAAPADGWAAHAGGTRGGAGAARADIVGNRTELLAALARDPGKPRIIRVAGVIDMSEGRPFSSSKDQDARGRIRLPSDTTLIGVGANAGFINAHISVSNASQVIIRNLHLRNPCDVDPKWDPKDGPAGEWNSLFDGVTVSGSRHVWIDHNSFTDSPVTDDLAPVENGRPKQCHDGSLDIGNGSDFVTVSYNRFADHEKNMLIGSGDRMTGDAGHLTVTLSNNVFERVSQRSPRVRYGQVHLFNNYYAGDRKAALYRHVYSVGIGKDSHILAHGNVFDIAGASSCADIVKNPGSSADGAFSDSGSLLNGQALKCDTRPATWKIPYSFKPLPAAEVKAHVLANAGAGKLAAAPAMQPPGAMSSADYMIEASLRRGTGQAILMGRWQDARNWYGASIALTGASPVAQVEIVRMHDGVETRLKQVKRRINGATALLRFELIGQALTVYLNGEKLSTALDTAIGAPGSTRLQGDLAADTVRTGDAAYRPARLAPAVGGQQVRTQAGDAPFAVEISNFEGDGVARFAFTATSSDPAVAAVRADGNRLIVEPKAAGQAQIVLAHAADPAVASTIDVNVGAAFAMPPGRHAGAVRPAPGERNVPVDTLLRVPSKAIGERGSVRIYRERDDALVDVIRPGEEVAAIGHAGQDQLRHVFHTPIALDGANAVIKPHQNKLAYGETYYVVAESGLVTAAGIGKAARWRFTTRAAPPAGSTLTVDDDGAADFRTVQGALNHAMQHGAKNTPLTIAVRNGRYDEMLFIRGKDKLTLQGESRDGVRIRSGNNDGYNPGSGLSQSASAPGVSGGRSLLLIENADLLTIATLTLHNTTLRSGKVAGQAETLYFNNDGGRLIARDATFLSEQDTIQVKGYSWFYRTLIAGNVDFIWGGNRAALFEESEIRSVGDSANKGSGGYVIQARTVAQEDKGFVFLNSTLTHGPGPLGNDVPAGTTYLARSPGTANTWDHVAYINCRMGPHVATVGWAAAAQRHPAPNPLQASASGGWREFGSMGLDGKPLDLAGRAGGYLMREDEVKREFGSRAAIFSRFDQGRGWDPQP